MKLHTSTPNRKPKFRVHGFRARMRTASGRKVIARRRLKGRARITIM